jgi:hypothetical protein
MSRVGRASRTRRLSTGGANDEAAPFGVVDPELISNHRKDAIPLGELDKGGHDIDVPGGSLVPQLAAEVCNAQPVHTVVSL